MAKGSLRKARWAALRGDYATAGDFYRLGGDLGKALEMYRKGRQHRLAAEVATELGQPDLASRQYERAGMSAEAADAALEAGDRERAARLLVLAGKTRRAAEIQEQAGRKAAAATLFEHSGDYLRAAQLFIAARQPQRAARALGGLSKSGAPNADLKLLSELFFECGQQLLASGCPESAALWFEKCGRSYEAARAWERAGNTERAIRAYLQASRTDEAVALAGRHAPETLDPALAAEAYRAAGDWASAAPLFLEAGQPSEAAACLEHLGCSAEAAWAHEAAGDLIAAAASLERASDHALAGALFRKAGSPADAARCFLACGDLNGAAECHQESGDFMSAAGVFEKLGDFESAVKALQKVDNDSPHAEAASFKLGHLFERKGLDSLAADHFRTALASEIGSTDDLEPWYRYASILERLGRFGEAIKSYERIVSTDIGFRDATIRLAELQERAAAAASDRPKAMPERYQIESPVTLPVPGLCYAGKDTIMRRRVMIRRFGPDIVPSDKAAARLLNDIRRVARLHHPAIAAVYDAGVDDNGVYLVQEFVDGRTLRETLDSDGAIDVPRTVQVMTRIAEALDYAHGLGLLARNIRPETVVVGPSFDARLTDFGLAIRHTDNKAASTGYRPPEAARGERMDPMSDIFQLGVLGWEMLLGFLPPAPKPDATEPPVLPLEGDRSVPDVLRRVIVGALQPDRSRRLGSAQELLEELHGTNMLPGALLANRYEILREIGHGGMGAVYAGKDLVLDEKVALKVLKGPFDETTEKRFVQEIRLARQISHRNIVRVHTLERWRDVRFIVMEFIEGVDLRAWCEKCGTIPLNRAVDLLLGIASGLAAAHRLGIVHRDVKPENVLIDSSGLPRLVDFGIARQGDVHLTKEGLVIGSPAYMAPEQIKGQAADQRADLYALGILAYMLLAGREPFGSDNVAEV
ncbi:MAG: protein kinase, partial [Acidobacteriota bacterium]|nr:protein kinase [Acidobacteriota bacterium]